MFPTNRRRPEYPIFYRDLERHRRYIHGHIPSPMLFVQQLSKNSKQTLTEAEILQLRGHDGFSLLEIAVERFNPTVATVAKTLNDLELDNALSILIPYVSSSTEREAFRRDIQARRMRASEIIVNQDMNRKLSGIQSPSSHVFLDNAVETPESMVNYRTNDSFKGGSAVPDTNFDDLVKLLLRLDEQRQTFGPIRFTTDRTDMQNCELGALEFTRKQSTDLTRRTFVCPDDQPRASRAACSELRILQRFRHPGLPPLVGYAYDVHSGSPDIIVLQLFTPRYSIGCLRNLLSAQDSCSKLDAVQRLRILQTTASTLSFLHNNKPDEVCHGNVCSRCIMLTEFMEPILFDFTNAYSPSHSSESEEESLNPEAYYYASHLQCSGLFRDIYSFGVLSLEVWLNEEPMAGYWTDNHGSPVVSSDVSLAERVICSTARKQTYPLKVPPFKYWSAELHQNVLEFVRPCLDTKQQNTANCLEKVAGEFSTLLKTLSTD
ncbi:Interleukin-1 receptor-associated kinase 3 [Clonorchis sinensis]|uniref:Interleukin-1 receptor-associated kinase 3 n=1 Tax=Clonorchis sinensis TaxID=79923 RepID=A0A8T1MBX1_CLOSI|nr:Interleukin-1 receptor-associated kinase 3 [Clonorchis sinensis]